MKASSRDAAVVSVMTSVLPSWRSWSRYTRMETFGWFLGTPRLPLASLAPKRKLVLCPRWCLPGLGRHGSRQLSLVRFTLHRTLRPLGAILSRPIPLEVLVSSASRGLAPREGLELLMSKMGHTRPLMEPYHGPQAG